MSRSNARFALAVVGVVVSCVLATTTRAAAQEAETTETPVSTTTTEAVGGALSADGPVEWFVRTSGGCGAGGESDRPASITKADVLCVAGLAPDPQLEGLRPDGDDADYAILAVESIEWDDDNVASGVVVGFRTAEGPAELRVSPDVGLAVEYRHLSPADGTGDASSSTDATITRSGPVTSLPELAPSVGVAALPPVAVGAGGLDKVVTLTGDDLSGVTGLTLRERVDEQLTVTGPDGLIAAEAGLVRLPFDGGGRTITYEIAAAPTLNSGVTGFDATTELLVGDTRIATAEQPGLELRAPAISVSPSLSGSAESGSRSLLAVEIRNGATAVAARPLTVTATPISGGGSVGAISGVSDGGTVVDGAVVWTLPEGLEAGDTAFLTFLAAFTEGSSNTEIAWRVSVSTGDSVLVQDESLVVPVAAGNGSDGPINFAPGQLIRLLAFVVAFAIMAVIYGAWSRGRTRQAEHGFRVFEIYAQSIIVIVILVAILVLALQGGLSGESAASLIGVIAGYVLRQA